MKKTIKFLSMAALAMVGAMTAGCSNDDNIIDQQQPENQTNVVTLTTTVGFDEATDGTTRALDINYTDKKLTKTFAVGDQIAVVYENTGGTKVKAESVALTAENITAEGKSATFTVTLTDPKASGTVKYIYPAAMAGETDVDYTNLNAQDGTLATIASNYDLAVYDGSLTAEATLPASPTLTNGLAIIAYTIKDADGTNDLTSTITGMTVSDGTNNYAVTRSAVAGPIYVAIQPTSGANIEYTATNGTKSYAKSVTSKTYAAGQFYQLGLRMAEAYKLLSAATAEDIGKVVCAAGHLHTAKTAVPTGCTAVGILGKVTETGCGLILALKDATSQTWNTINGWTSVTTYASTTLKVLPDDAAHGSLTSYAALGTTAVSDWAVAQKSDYEAIFTNLGSTTGDGNGKTYDANVNAYITTGVGGTALDGYYWSATEKDGGNALAFISSLWGYSEKTNSLSVRPVLGFGPAKLLSAATTSDVGKVVCADGHLRDAKTAVPAGGTAVGILGKVTETGHGLILALQDATAQECYTIDGWTSTTDYASTTLKVLPDDARGSLTGYTALGATAVSNWAVAQMSDYQAIFQNLGSTTNSDGMTYDANVNAYITTGVGGTALSGYYWSATEYRDVDAWGFSSGKWDYDYKVHSHSVRPVLGF